MAAAKRTLGAVMALTLTLACGAAQAQGSDLQSGVAALAYGWARATYEVHDSRMKAADAGRLADQAAALAQRYPGRPEPLAWEGLLLLVQADAEHSLHSLKLAGRARALLEAARRIDPNAIGPGVIDANLGALYAQIPGRQISFGDRAKARRYFALALDEGPKELEVNYLYGEFLLQEGDPEGAANALQRALDAPPRPGLHAADIGRKTEAAQLLAKALGRR